MKSLFLPDLEATERFAARLVAVLPTCLEGWTILLQGELGSGKSSLARAMLHSMGHSGAVPSPTYTLVEPYKLPQVTLYHIDLYRIADQEELEFLGWSDLDDGLRLVEWPERVPGLEARSDLLVDLGYDGDGRALALTGLSQRGEELIERLSSL